MLRLPLRASRSAVHRPPANLPFLQSRSIYQTYNLRQASTKQQYLKFLADLKRNGISLEPTATERIDHPAKRSSTDEHGPIEPIPPKTRRKRIPKVVELNGETPGESTPPKARRKRTPKTIEASEQSPVEAATPKSRRKRTTKVTEAILNDGVGAVAEKANLEPEKSRRAPSKTVTISTPVQLQVKAHKLTHKEKRTSERPSPLIENPWEDITKFLESKYKLRTPLGDNKRAHVISESLCGKEIHPQTDGFQSHIQ